MTGDSEARGNDRISMLFWTPSLTFLAHTLEELPDFPAWVSSHFAPMSLLEFATLHIPLIGLVAWVSFKASAVESRAFWRFLALAFQWQFAFNALFHLASALAFLEYSPGMVTAAVIGLPATFYMARSYRRSGILSSKGRMAAPAAGLAIALSAIGSLFV